LRALWQEHRRWVAAILLAHKPAWADVDDLLQDVAVAVVRKVGDLRDAGALKPWLRTVAINAANAAARGGKKRGVSLDAVGEDGVAGRVGDAGVERVRIRDEAARVLALAQQLPDGYREPLLMKAVQGMSYREIGEVLGLPETTVETRIARGRRMLRELAEAGEAAGAHV
jgi:RNA polymerase sigma-70 factor (ECF subfamily)